MIRNCFWVAFLGVWSGLAGAAGYVGAGERYKCHTVEAYVESPAAYPIVHPCGGQGGGAGQHLCVSVKTN